MLTVNTKGLGKLRTSRHGHKSRKAISNVITTILLVVVGIILVGVVFGISSGILGHAAPSTGVQFTSATISGETGLISVTVQNTGSAVATGLTVTVYGGSLGSSGLALTCSSTTPSPGATSSCTGTSSSIVSGVTYTIQAVITTASGSSTASDNVVAS